MVEDIDTLTIDARRYAENIILQADVRIVNLKMVRFRIRLALWLCRIAVWLGGIGLEINQEVGVLITESDSEYDKFLEQEKQEIDEILEQLND